MAPVETFNSLDSRAYILSQGTEENSNAICSLDIQCLLDHSVESRSGFYVHQNISSVWSSQAFNFVAQN